METIALRELRNQASRVVRRARAGERIVITVDGVPVAQIGPLVPDGHESTLDSLIAQGRVLRPHSTEPPRPATPIRLQGRSTTEVLNALRDR
jgi:prevent-host-death family protein